MKSQYSKKRFLRKSNDSREREEDYQSPARTQVQSDGATLSRDSDRLLLKVVNTNQNK